MNTRVNVAFSLVVSPSAEKKEKTRSKCVSNARNWIKAGVKSVSDGAAGRIRGGKK